MGASVLGKDIVMVTVINDDVRRLRGEKQKGKDLDFYSEMGSH